MTRSKPLTALLLTGAAMLVLSGCHTTVVEPAPQPAHHDDYHDDQRDDRHDDQPPPPPPDHHDDHR